MDDSSESGCCEVNCIHCTGTDSSDRCCWATAMEIKKFQQAIKRKYIFEVILDMIISTTSVVTDIATMIMYFLNGKKTFALLTAIPVLLPTFVFTNVYLANESTPKKPPMSRVISVISDDFSTDPEEERQEPSGERKNEDREREENIRGSTLAGESTDSSSIASSDKESRCQRCMQNCAFHWSCMREPFGLWKSCFQCCCTCNIRMRRSGAIAVKNSIQRLIKYGFGTFVLRIIAWMWYVKAFIFGIKAYREPKKFMHIAKPDTHWSYELLVRLDFLQAGLENAPQVVVQMYALITQPDENIVLAMFTLAVSFVDFIRVVISVHWDMNKGPVIAPSGCYETKLWKVINILSWIFIYSARSAAIALVFATAFADSTPAVFFPSAILLIHIVLFGKLLSRAKYGVAAQKIVVTVFISLFFLPELDSSILPHLIQFYYACITIQNTLFIVPWQGFDKDYCITSSGYQSNKRTSSTSNRPSPTTHMTPGPTHSSTTGNPVPTHRAWKIITGSTETPQTDLGPDCFIDPVWISLAVPTITIFGVIFRLISSQKMFHHKKSLPQDDEGQTKLEVSISKIFNKSWSQMTAGEMFQAFLKMLKKEVIIMEKDGQGSVPPNVDDLKCAGGNVKRTSVLAGRLQADFLASQAFIRESFSLMTRTTRSHDLSIGDICKDTSENPTEYNSDSELTFRKNVVKKRPKISRSRNTSESLEVVESSETILVPVDLPGGTQFLEMCWI